MEVTETSRGGKKLCMNGYIYTNSRPVKSPALSGWHPHFERLTRSPATRRLSPADGEKLAECTKMHHLGYKISKFSRGWYPRTPSVTITDKVKVFQARCSTTTIAAYNGKERIDHCWHNALLYDDKEISIFTACVSYTRSSSWERQRRTIVTKIWHNIARNFM